MSTAPRHPLPPELRDELAERAEGQELAQVWDLLALVDPVPGSSEAEAVWNRVSKEIAKGRPILTPTFTPTVTSPGVRAVPSVTPRRRSVAPWAIAATLAVAAGLGVWQSTPVVVEAPLGEQLAVTLPDGSRAELNAGSSLEYARGFRRLAGLAAGSRAVKLDGEAYFSVVRSNRTFSVTTTDARITVLGTSFVVRAHSGEPDGTLVGVESGRVRVESVSGAGDSAVELVAGQETQVQQGVVLAQNISPVDMDRLMLWRQGGIALVNLPLDAIFRELERRYAVDIRLRDVAIGDERLAVYYPERPSIESVLNDLCTIRGLRFSRTSRGFDITPQEERVLPSP
jgi:ferric-dicitrate binding protein FerR (iron transport regulator)